MENNPAMFETTNQYIYIHSSSIYERDKPLNGDLLTSYAQLVDIDHQQLEIHLKTLGSEKYVPLGIPITKMFGYTNC